MTDIFNDGTKPADQQPTVVAPPQPEIPDDLKEFIGEGKKYADLASALRSVAPAQQHISKLEQELADLRARAASATATDDVLKVVQDLLAKPDSDPGKQLDEAQVASLVENLLTSREAKTREASNVAHFKEELAKVYKDKDQEVFAATAQRNGLSVAELSDLVRRSPAAALRLFDIKPQGSRALQSDVNLDSFGKPTNNVPEKRNVMHGSSKQDVLHAWRRAGELAKQQNNQE